MRSRPVPPTAPQVRGSVARRVRRLRSDDLQRLHVPSRKVLPFVEVADHRPRGSPTARALAPPAPVQGALF